MNRQGSRRLLGAGAALAFGVSLTIVGFVLQRSQMAATIQSQSVKPLLDPARNAVITICLPVLAVADKLPDYGFGLFIVFSALNAVAWASILFVAGVLIFNREGRGRGRHEPAA